MKTKHSTAERGCCKRSLRAASCAQSCTKGDCKSAISLYTPKSRKRKQIPKLAERGICVIKIRAEISEREQKNNQQKTIQESKNWFSEKSINIDKPLAGQNKKRHQNSQLHRNKVKQWLQGAGTGRNGGLLVKRYRVSVWHEKVLGMDSGEGYTWCE